MTLLTLKFRRRVHNSLLFWHPYSESLCFLANFQFHAHQFLSNMFHGKCNACCPIPGDIFLTRFWIWLSIKSILFCFHNKLFGQIIFALDNLYNKLCFHAHHIPNQTEIATEEFCQKSLLWKQNEIAFIESHIQILHHLKIVCYSFL